MTMVNDGVNFWPQSLVNELVISSAGGAGTATFDSTADKLAYVGTYYGANDSIASVKFRVGAIAATAGVGVQVRIETVVNGVPSGTLWSAHSTGVAPTASVTIADTDDNTFKTATLTNAANLVAGDEFAIVIIYEAGNDDGTFSVPFNYSSSVVLTSAFYPRCLQDTGGGTWVGTISSAPFDLQWIVTMTSAGIIYLPGLSPINGAVTLSTLANNAAADERALRFQSPSKKRTIGMRAVLGNITAGGDFQFALWSATGDEVGEELAVTSTIDGDFSLSTTQDGVVSLFFTAPYTIAANTTYYAGVKALSTNSFVLFECPVAAAGDKAGFPLPNATQIYGAVRTWDETQTPDLAGAWTTSTTTLPLISLIIDQIDDGAGTGGANPINGLIVAR